MSTAAAAILNLTATLVATPPASARFAEYFGHRPAPGRPLVRDVALGLLELLGPGIVADPPGELRELVVAAGVFAGVEVESIPALARAVAMGRADRKSGTGTPPPLEKSAGRTGGTDTEPPLPPSAAPAAPSSAPPPVEKAGVIPPGPRPGPSASGTRPPSSPRPGPSASASRPGVARPPTRPSR